MIAIWYNPHKEDFYSKYVKGAYFKSDYEVGYINQYGHKLVALFMIQGNKLIKCDSLKDYYYNKKTFKKRLINHLIDLLNKLK